MGKMSVQEFMKNQEKAIDFIKDYVRDVMAWEYSEADCFEDGEETVKVYCCCFNFSIADDNVVTGTYSDDFQARAKYNFYQEELVEMLNDEDRGYLEAEIDENYRNRMLFDYLETAPELEEEFTKITSEIYDDACEIIKEEFED